MWNRKELKEKGKAALKRNYWKSVLVSAVFAGVIGLFVAFKTKTDKAPNIEGYYDENEYE